MSDSAFTLARWFTERREADEFQREDLLEDLYGDRVVAARMDRIRGEQIIVRTHRQTCVIEQENYMGSTLVMFDSVANDRWERVGYWFNLSSVEGLLDKLRQEATADFDTLFLGARITGTLQRYKMVPVNNHGAPAQKETKVFYASSLEEAYSQAWEYWPTAKRIRVLYSDLAKD